MDDWLVTTYLSVSARSPVSAPSYPKQRKLTSVFDEDATSEGKLIRFINDILYRMFKFRQPGVGGGDKSQKSESSGPHLARGSQHIYKHILFYWYPTKNAKMTPPGHAEVGPGPSRG